MDGKEYPYTQSGKMEKLEKNIICFYRLVRASFALFESAIHLVDI